MTYMHIYWTWSFVNNDISQLTNLNDIAVILQYCQTLFERFLIQHLELFYLSLLNVFVRLCGSSLPVYHECLHSHIQMEVLCVVIDFYNFFHNLRCVVTFNKDCTCNANVIPYIIGGYIQDPDKQIEWLVLFLWSLYRGAFHVFEYRRFNCCRINNYI